MPVLSRSFTRECNPNTSIDVRKRGRELAPRDEEEDVFLDADVDRFRDRVDNLFGNWITAWDPFVPASRRFYDLEDFRDRFYREMDEVFDTSASKELASWQPKTRILETKDGKTLIKAEMPGLSKEDVKVDFSKGILTVKGEKKIEEKSGDNEKIETRSFLRSFRLPDDVDPKEIKAKMEHGVLELTLPSNKQPQATGQPISIE